MSETCPICGRPSVKTFGLGVPGTSIDKVCFRVKAGADTTCYQVGYEREKARADDWQRLAETNAAALAELTAALAAARQECGETRTKYLREGFMLAEGYARVSQHDGWTSTAPFIDWSDARDQLEAALSFYAALAAPAAGDFKAYPEPRCTCHARKTGKHAQSCELWNTTGDL